MATAAVLGASGYLGGELLRLLSDHPRLDLTHAVSSSHAGEPLAKVAPHLDGKSSLTLEGGVDAVDVDVAFLALPAGEAMRVVPPLLERGIRVIDLGPDYRLKDPVQYQRVYGRPHADAAHLAESVYGLPELHREALRSARLVANPGCYPTATLLALAPLVRSGVIGGAVVVDAKSGTSGAGQGLTAGTHHPEAALSVVPYGSPEHRHAPEIAGELAELGQAPEPLVFVPHLVPIVRGILCSIYPTPSGASGGSEWEGLLRSSYAASPFVHVGPTPRLPWTFGTNHCYLSVQPVGSSHVLFSALDNLGKGGAAQAVQNANLLFGWPEETGLGQRGFAI